MASASTSPLYSIPYNITRNKDQSRTGNVGILIKKTIQFTLTKDEIEQLSADAPQQITRHMDPKHLNSTVKGYFRFGTIDSYAPADKKLNSGRFGDYQEGTTRETFRTRGGIFKKFEADGLVLQDVHISGVEHPVVVELTVNDYCSCSSVGPYSRGRLENLRQKGNDELSAFVTYDTRKLLDSLSKILLEDPKTADLHMIGRTVVYGPKDRHWTIEDDFKASDRDNLAVWLGTAFVKSPAYAHEEEYRLLLVAPQGVGALAAGTDALEFRDSRIADAIVHHGLL